VELVSKKKLQLLAGRTHPELAVEIAGHLGVELGETNLVDFADTEIRCRFGESVRGSDVFIIQTHGMVEGRSVNDAILEQLIMIDAAKRASAKRITAVCPYYGYARQDRKAEGREPISAKLLADLFRAAGAALDPRRKPMSTYRIGIGGIDDQSDEPAYGAGPLIVDVCVAPDEVALVEVDEPGESRLDR